MLARRQLNWNGGGGGMDSQYKLLSELLSDQAAFITSPKTSLANNWGHCPPAPPLSTGLLCKVGGSCIHHVTLDSHLSGFLHEKSQHGLNFNSASREN